MQDGVTMATQPTDTAKPRVRATSDELTVIAQRAQAFTNASGTAIALSEGNADEIVCRARSGSAAPEVGAALRVEGSFTGLCIQSGKELRCDDAETDTRVDTAAIRALGIRSMVVTPIKEDNKVIGVLACFAPTAHAFTITHVAVLKTMADQITALLQKERRARDEGAVPAPVRLAAPEVSVAKPTVPAASAPVPVVMRPAPSTAPAPARNQFPVVSRVEPVAAPALFTKKEEKRAEVRASFGTLDAVAGEGKKSDPKIKVLGAVAVLLVAGLATFGVLKMRKPGAPAAAQQSQNTATPAANALQQPVQPQTQAVASVPAGSGTPGTGAVPATSNPGRTAPIASALDVTRRPDKPSAKAPEKSSVTDEAEKPAPASTVALSSGPSHIKANQNTQGTDVAPTLTVGGGSATGTISALATPVASTTPAALRAQSDLEPMKVLKEVKAIYPVIAKTRRISGQITVEFTIGKDGKAHNLKMAGGQPIFRDAAFDAIKQWVFKPAMLNGEPIEQTTQIKMQFNP
ncbi:MAG TPA: TonB family protein [Candidatus Angelobacter sp.]